MLYFLVLSKLYHVFTIIMYYIALFMKHNCFLVLLQKQPFINIYTLDMTLLEKYYLTLLIVQSELCGHGTLAAAHYLISSGSDAIEFVAKSGRLTAKEVVGPEDASNLYSTAQYTRSKFFVELDFPVISVVKCNTAEVFSLPGSSFNWNHSC